MQVWIFFLLPPHENVDAEESAKFCYIGNLYYLSFYLDYARIHHGSGHAAEVDALRGLIIRNNRTLKDKQYKPDS